MNATSHYSTIFSIRTTTTTNPNNKNPSFLSLSKSLKCVQSPIHAATFTTPQTTDPHRLESKLLDLTTEFTRLTDATDRLTRLLHYSSTALPPFPHSSRVDSNRVMGCTARVWVDVRLDDTGSKVVLRADSDSELTRGLCACLVWLLDGEKAEEVLKVKAEDLMALGGVGRSRGNTWHNVLLAVQKRTKRLVAERDGKAVAFDPFPSLVITKDGIRANGSFAEAQVRFFESGNA